MKKWLAYMKGRYMTAEYIVSRDVYGDWCAPPSTAEAGKGLSRNVKSQPLLIHGILLSFHRTDAKIRQN